MSNDLCGKLKTDYRELKALEKKFSEGLENIGQTRDIGSMKRIQTRMEDRLGKIRNIIYVSLEQARHILREDFIEPEESFRALGLEIDYRFIPRIPFSARMLEIAQRKGIVLIYSPLKGMEIEQLHRLALENTSAARVAAEENLDAKKKAHIISAAKEGVGHLFSSVSMKFPREEFRGGWSLVYRDSKQIAGQKSVNLLRQIDKAVDLLKELAGPNLARSQTNPMVVWREAIREYERKKPEVKNWLEKNKLMRAGEEISKLKIMNFILPNATEFVFASYVFQTTTGEKLFSNGSCYWINKREHTGKFYLLKVTRPIGFGGFNPTGGFIPFEFENIFVENLYPGITPPGNGNCIFIRG